MIASQTKLVDALPGANETMGAANSATNPNKMMSVAQNYEMESSKRQMVRPIALFSSSCQMVAALQCALRQDSPSRRRDLRCVITQWIELREYITILLCIYMCILFAGILSKAADKTKKEGERNRIVAIKKIRLGHEKDGVSFTALREIKLLQEIQHPNVIVS